MKPVAIFRYARTEGPGHFATFLSEHGLHFTLDPARLPSGLTSTLRAPLTAPEPAMTGAGAHP